MVRALKELFALGHVYLLCGQGVIPSVVALAMFYKCVVSMLSKSFNFVLKFCSML